MHDLNEAVRTELDGVHYATMVAVAFMDEEVCSYSATRVTHHRSGIAPAETNGRGSTMVPNDIGLV